MSLRILLAVLLILILAGIGSAFATANSIPETGVAILTTPISAQDVAPPECEGMGLVQIMFSAGNTNNRPTLILGTAGPDDLRGGRGRDCIVGGAGDDILRGQQDDDVLLGGAGDDALDGGAGVDTCYDDSGINSFTRCE